MEQKQAKNDQQATNAALAALAAAGNTFALGQLWEVNKGFIRRQLWQWYEKNKPVADNAGLSFEDLVQEGYFAVDYAAKHYSAEQGNFTTYLSYALLKQIRTATCGEHTRVVATENGRRVAVSANPLNECSSLDVRLDESDEGSSTKGETIEDPAAVQAFQQAEDDIYTEELHTALETAMTQHLTEREATVLRRRYYDGQTLQAIGKELGVRGERVRIIEGKAICKMKGLSTISAGMMMLSAHGHGAELALVHGRGAAACRSGLWNIGNGRCRSTKPACRHMQRSTAATSRAWKSGRHENANRDFQK